MIFNLPIIIELLYLILFLKFELAFPLYILHLGIIQSFHFLNKFY